MKMTSDRNPRLPNYLVRGDATQNESGYTLDREHEKRKQSRWSRLISAAKGDTRPEHRNTRTRTDSGEPAR